GAAHAHRPTSIRSASLRSRRGSYTQFRAHRRVALRCAGRTAPSRGLWTSSVSMMKEEPMYDDTQDSILETPAERLGASRRLFLGLAGAGTGAAALSACAAGGGGGDDEGGGSGVSGGDGEV